MLKSLFSDEMTPLETAIKNRIKEAFLLKIEVTMWSAILSTVQDSMNIVTDTGSNTELTNLKFRLVPVSTSQTDFQD